MSVQQEYRKEPTHDHQTSPTCIGITIGHMSRGLIRRITTRRSKINSSPLTIPCLWGRCPRLHPADDFLDGAAEVFYSGDTDDVPLGREGFRSDARALRSYWITVGSYIETGVQSVADSIETSSVGQLVLPHMTEDSIA